MAERGNDETKAAAGDATLQAEGGCRCAELRAALAAAESRAAAAEAALEELRAKVAAGEHAGGKAEEDEAAESRGRHFRDSTILARVEAGSVAGTAVDGLQALLGWLPGPHYTPKGQTWTLIYRGSRDGWLQSDFHAACDDKGPTLTLVVGTMREDFGGREFVAGGYAAGSWTSPRLTQTVADPDSAQSVGRSSFLFSLVDGEGHGPVQLRLKHPEDDKAQQHMPSRGPTFGGGDPDFMVGGYDRYKPINGANNSWTATAGEDCSYDVVPAGKQGCTTFNGEYEQNGYRWFTTTELEVFALQ